MKLFRNNRKIIPLFKTETINFNVDIASTNRFKYFMYKTKLLGKIEADGNNGIQKNSTFGVPLKDLSNF